ncbi:hypothetical protein PTSG_02334 [Salpingoeca rosetta]|uniref:Uncharacterized protein n=1 Tax=Salpingoeca rosetta (strain ATCC 50818 / BSB-021) TaxID=946362 RepID=F2U1W5_SALR5|nr:uncharacterized protein PTSG_02334 [Salpingoeca rosetta]EGD81617.1 hypothetical protein PTSG_02334 [Salpingoeca rosetta]|eukprot:XP_004996821.1 hypothetical protein PTSG_02334 [Salpingoeca rosetta]
MSLVVAVGAGLAIAVVAFVAVRIMSSNKNESEEAKSKNKYGVVLPKFSSNNSNSDTNTAPVRGKDVACSLHFQGIGGKPAGPAGVESLGMLQDFAPFTACVRVEDPRSVLVDNPDLTVYSLFEDDKAVVLVEPAPVSITKDLTFARTFHYQELRGSAHKRAVLLSFAGLHSAVEALKAAHGCAEPDAERALLSRVVFVHSTGRCGSTLLSKALGSAYGVHSIAEPDIYSAVFLALKEGRMTRPEAKQVLRDATFLLAARAGLTSDAGSSTDATSSATAALAVKFRSWVALDADIVHDAVPEAKNQLHAGSLARVFGEDAHGPAATTTSSRKNIQDLTHNPLYIRDSDLAPLNALLRKTKLPDTTDYILPGTLTSFPPLSQADA